MESSKQVSVGTIEGESAPGMVHNHKPRNNPPTSAKNKS